MNKGRKIFDSKTKGLMKMWRKRGMTYSEIAKKLYCSRETARRYITLY